MRVGIGKCARASRLGRIEARDGAYYSFRAFFASGPERSKRVTLHSRNRRAQEAIGGADCRWSPAGGAVTEPAIRDRGGGTAAPAGMVMSVRCRGSGDGEHGAILEAGVEGTGAALAAASGAGAVQQSDQRPQIRSCGPPGPGGGVRGGRTDAEFHS